MWFRRRGDSLQESEKALEEAERVSEEIKSRSSEVTELSEAIRRIRERNHFAEQLEDVIRRRRGSTP